MELLEKRKCHYIGLYFMQIVTKEALRILFRSTHESDEELKKESEFIIDYKVNKHFLKYLVSPQTPVALDNNTKLFIDEKIPLRTKESIRLDISKISEAQETCTNSREFYNTLCAKYPVDETYDSIFPTLRESFHKYESTCFENFGYGINSWGLDLLQEELCERYTRTNSAKISYERAKIDLTRCTTIIGANCSFRARYEGRDYIFFGENHVRPDRNVPYDPHSISLYSFLQCIFAVNPEKKYDFFFEQASPNESMIDVKKPIGFEPSLLNFTDFYFKNYLSLEKRDFEDIYPNLRVHNLDARERDDSNATFPKRIRYPNQRVSGLNELLKDSRVIQKELDKIHPDEREYILNFAQGQIEALRELYTTRSSLMYRQNGKGSNKYQNTYLMEIIEPTLTEDELIQKINEYDEYNMDNFSIKYFALLTDVYAFARMIRKFEGYDSDCTIVFSGAAHTMNYFEIFSNLPGCEIMNNIIDTTGTPYVTESNTDRQYLHNYVTKAPINAKMLARTYFEIPESVFVNIPENLLEFFEQIRTHEDVEYYTNELTKIMIYIESKTPPGMMSFGKFIKRYKKRTPFIVLSKYTQAYLRFGTKRKAEYDDLPNKKQRVEGVGAGNRTSESLAEENEIFQRCLFKFYVLLVKYLNSDSVTSISFEDNNKFLKSLHYFETNSTSNYTRYHKRIRNLVQGKTPAYSPPPSPPPSPKQSSPEISHELISMSVGDPRSTSAPATAAARVSEALAIKQRCTELLTQANDALNTLRIQQRETNGDDIEKLSRIEKDITLAEDTIRQLENKKSEAERVILENAPRPPPPPPRPKPKVK